MRESNLLRLRNTPRPLTRKLKWLPERNTRSIAHIGLAEQSAAYPVRAKTVLLSLAKTVARRATIVHYEVHEVTSSFVNYKIGNLVVGTL